LRVQAYSQQELLEIVEIKKGLRRLSPSARKLLEEITENQEKRRALFQNRPYEPGEAERLRAALEPEETSHVSAADAEQRVIDVKS
jgi:hypothetical protein